MREQRKKVYTFMMLAAGDMRKAGLRKSILANDRYRELKAAGDPEPDKDFTAALMAFQAALYSVCADATKNAARGIWRPNAR